MTTNEINNQTELNLQETHLLRRLDEQVQVRQPKAIETQYGDVIVRKNVVGGFSASINSGKRLNVVFAFTASDAFLKMANKLRGAN